MSPAIRRLSLLTPVLWSLSCAAPPQPAGPDPDAPPSSLSPETELPPQSTGQWTLAGAELRLETGGLLTLSTPETSPQWTGVVGLPSVDAAGERVVWSQWLRGGPETALMLATYQDGWQPRTLLAGPGSPDRPALSPDGQQVFFVWGASGLASLWSMPSAGGEPQQRTNVGLHATPGQAPAGFVPVPQGGPPQVGPSPADPAALLLTWSSPDGPQRLEVRP